MSSEIDYKMLAEKILIKRLITKAYPKGFISLVSDTFDLWKTVSTILPQLKDEIMARDGKVVIRPDSGDPADIICGDPNGKTEAERKGVVEILWDIFGGATSDLGFKCLDSHIGCIYGDAITLDRCKDICERLAAKGFASINVVFGIGSFTYQYNTRDTFGFALKSTLCVIDGVEHQIYKDPKTDSGMKKSQKGGVSVYRDKKDGVIKYEDEQSFGMFRGDDLLELTFLDGKLLRDESLAEIRARL